MFILRLWDAFYFHKLFFGCKNQSVVHHTHHGICSEWMPIGTICIYMCLGKVAIMSKKGKKETFFNYYFFSFLVLHSIRITIYQKTWGILISLQKFYKGEDSTVWLLLWVTNSASTSIMVFFSLFNFQERTIAYFLSSFAFVAIRNGQKHYYIFHIAIKSRLLLKRIKVSIPHL